jgi:hypothetical protein
VGDGLEGSPVRDGAGMLAASPGGAPPASSIPFVGPTPLRDGTHRALHHLAVWGQDRAAICRATSSAASGYASLNGHHPRAAAPVRREMVRSRRVVAGSCRGAAIVVDWI